MIINIQNTNFILSPIKSKENYGFCGYEKIG